MKKIILLSAAAMAALLAASSAQAQETAVQFYFQNQLSAGQAAGIDGFTGWQTLQVSSGAFYPFGNQGTTLQTTSGFGVTLHYDGFYNPNFGGPTIPGDPGSTKLLQAGVGTTGGTVAPTTGTAYGPDAVTMSLAGLTSGDQYAIALYIGGSQYNPSEGSVSVTGAATQYFMTARQGNFYPSMPNALVDGGSTTDFIAAAIAAHGNSNIGLTGSYYGAGLSASSYQSNYLEFSFVASGSETVTLTQLGSFGSGNAWEANSTNMNQGNVIGLDGFELIDEGAAAPVPEPSTVWMFSLGFLGLMVHVYRKRYAQS
jgi:type II secretory pathway pseudopilin PulG